MKRFQDNTIAVLGYYLPANIDIDVVTDNLIALFDVANERSDLDIMDIYYSLLSEHKIIDLGQYAKYIVRIYGLLLAGNQVQQMTLDILNMT